MCFSKLHSVVPLRTCTTKRQSEGLKQGREEFTWKEKKKAVEETSRSWGTCHKWSSKSEGRAGKRQ